MTLRAPGARSPLEFAVRRGSPNGEPTLAATPKMPRRCSLLDTSSWPRRATNLKSWQVFFIFSFCICSLGFCDGCGGWSDKLAGMVDVVGQVGRDGGL